jgi:hypothetical protein
MLWGSSNMPQKKIGQVNVYFIISVMLFISLSIYLVYLLMSFYPSKGEAMKINALYGKSYSISELLIKDEGYPADWNENNIERIGLSSIPYELNFTKLSRFKKMCDPYNKTSREIIYNSSGLSDSFFIINIAYLNGTSIIQCSPSGDIEKNPEFLRKRTAPVKRIATLNGEIVEMEVYVG